MKMGITGIKKQTYKAILCNYNYFLEQYHLADICNAPTVGVEE